MSRVAHISPGTVVVYRISLVLEVDVVSSKVRCVTGAAVNGSADPESLRDIWPPPTDDIIFLLSVDQVQVRYFVSTGNLAGLFQGIFIVEEYNIAIVQSIFFLRTCDK